ncbi:MAG: competence/damage-inducible protein A [Deltaproteobacteria bacterium]|nr:competence/damage-inducible protein A [Deltaproteobacteria bacterium]
MKNKNTAEIIAIGSELLLGQIIDTNTPYLASRLQEIGLETAFQTMVGDDRQRMISVIRRALSRSRFIITTGGIGPTEDDLTREVVAEVCGKKLIFHPKLFKLIKSLFFIPNCLNSSNPFFTGTVLSWPPTIASRLIFRPEPASFPIARERPPDSWWKQGRGG